MDKRTKSKVQATLETLSKTSKLPGKPGLNRAYDDALERIKSQLADDARLALRALSWITFAKRQLTIDEICHAFAVEPDDEDLDPDNILDINDIVSVCAGLVVVDEESQIVHLVHYTTQVYLEKLPDWSSNANMDIAQTCLHYLSLIKIPSPGTEFNPGNSRYRLNPFLDYASWYWGEHALIVEEAIYDQVIAFFSNSVLMYFAMHSLGRYRTAKSLGMKRAAHYAAFAGLPSVLKTLLIREPATPENEEETYSTLRIAVFKGHLHIVELLVDIEPQLYPKSKNALDEALCVAAKHGQEHVARFLVEKGACIHMSNSRMDHYTQSPLQFAAASGQRNMVNLLLDLGANIDEKGRGGTALELAIARNHQSVVELLLDRGANIEPLSKSGSSAVGVASSRADEHLVRLLFEKGTKPNPRAGLYVGALQSALYVGWRLKTPYDPSSGMIEVVKLLLSNITDINWEGNLPYKRSALQPFPSPS